MENKTSTGKWGKAQNQLLQSLFEKRLDRGGISPEDTTRKTVEAVRNKYFPGRTYASFAPLFRRKARQFQLNESLNGARANDDKQPKGELKNKSRNFYVLLILMIIFIDYYFNIILKSQLKATGPKTK